MTDSAIPWTAARQVSLSINSSQSLLKMHADLLGDAIQPSQALSFDFPPTFNLYQDQGLY